MTEYFHIEFKVGIEDQTMRYLGREVDLDGIWVRPAGVPTLKHAPAYLTPPQALDDFEAWVVDWVCTEDGWYEFAHPKVVVLPHHVYARKVRAVVDEPSEMLPPGWRFK